MSSANATLRRMRFDEVLRTFGEFFEREGVRWAVGGGLAMHAWGYSRSTNDIDFIVDGAARAKVIAFAESLGYETYYASEGFSNHANPNRDRGKIDLLYVYGETADRVFASATSRIAAGEVSAPVLSPEHLAMMKALAMKNRPTRVLIDSPDVAFLLDLPSTDRKAVRDYFEKIGLLQLYEQITNERPSRF